MEKTKRDLIVAIGLAVVCLFLIGRNFLFKSKAHPPASAVSQASDVQGVSLLGLIRQNQSLWEAQRAEIDQAWGRDPFLPEGSAWSAGAFPLNLSGIVWDEKMPVAIVNGKVLKKGESIENYKLEEIKPGSIVLSNGEKKIELQLFQTN